MRPRSILAFSNFFAVAHFYLIVYIVTPYLATMIAPETAALSVALGAILTLSLFPYIPRLVVKHGPQKMAVVFAVLEGVALLCLATYPSALLATLLIALACAIPPFIVYQLDLLLEACVDDETITGRIRTGFITAGNIALIISPLLIGYLLGGNNRYDLVFIAAALSLVPFILLMFTRSLPTVHPPGLRSLRAAGVTLLGDKDRRAVAFSNLALQFFFHIIPLYVPLYLHTVLGFPWSSLGLIFAASLIPFVLLEYPAGWLADTKFGDTGLLAIGFVISGLSIACLALVTADTSLLLIFFILFALRVGGALMEAMTEAHFFRRVSADDAEMVSIFRMMRPLGALTAPIIGSILLSAAGYGGVFVVSGAVIVVGGIACAYAIRSATPLSVLAAATPLPPPAEVPLPPTVAGKKVGGNESLWCRSGRC